MAKENNVNPNSFKAAVRDMSISKESLDVKLRLTNSSDRTLHYISDIRATRYDPVTKTLRLSLSDEGRQIIPQAIQKLPEFKYVDPNSEVELALKIPSKIIKLSKTGDPKEIAFEKHELSEAVNIVVEVGWSDVPYYTDTRKKVREEKRLPAERWEKHKAVSAKFEKKLPRDLE